MATPVRGSSDARARLESLLNESASRKASDLLLVAEAAPTAYVNGEWVELSKKPLLDAEIIAIIEPWISNEQGRRLTEVRDLDLGITVPHLGRFRMNVHYQRGTMAVAIRAIPENVPSFGSLGLPAQVISFSDYPNGLVLVTGGTGQGKSTTLAALVDHMNRGRRRHVITIEDPIEFAFRKGTCLIEQRQIGDDAPSFPSALRHVLRQRPDVILIGEMRDLETIGSALTAAETGHLVLGTLHTCSASQTIARIIDVFPSAQQTQVRSQLAGSLRAILCQSLLRDELNDSLLAATELMIATAAVRRAIRENEAHLIYSMIETGRTLGMHTLEQSLKALVDEGRIEVDAAVSAAADPIRMQAILGTSGRALSRPEQAAAVPSEKSVVWSQESLDR